MGDQIDLRAFAKAFGVPDAWETTGEISDATKLVISGKVLLGTIRIKSLDGSTDVSLTVYDGVNNSGKKLRSIPVVAADDGKSVAGEIKTRIRCQTGVYVEASGGVQAEWSVDYSKGKDL